jgi:beta-lactam-binding protein with PASTA domain
MRKINMKAVVVLVLVVSAIFAACKSSPSTGGLPERVKLETEDKITTLEDKGSAFGMATPPVAQLVYR